MSFINVRPLTRVVSLLSWAAVMSAAGVMVTAQQDSSQDISARALRTTHVRAGIHLITGAGGNIVVQVGNDGVLLVDAGREGTGIDVLTAVSQLTDGPIRYIVNTGADLDHVGGNVTLRQSGDTFTGGNATAVGGVDVGAAVVSHENLLHRVSGSRSPARLAIGGWPTETFFVAKYDLFFNDEPVEILHQQAAVSDSDTMVHFRRSDVLATGDIYRMDQYPVIDLASGGSINGLLDALNRVLDITVPAILQEGGTIVLPGHWRISDESEVVWYRDMVTIIRDRVAALANEGRTLDEILAARPGLDYDWRYGSSADWTANMFIEAVYRSLEAR